MKNAIFWLCFTVCTLATEYFAVELIEFNARWTLVERALHSPVSAPLAGQIEHL